MVHRRRTEGVGRLERAVRSNLLPRTCLPFLASAACALLFPQKQGEPERVEAGKPAAADPTDPELKLVRLPELLPMAVSSRIHAPPAARGLLHASTPRILPVERAPRRLAPCVRAISGGPGAGGSPVPRRPPAPADAAAVAPPSAPSSASSAIDFLTLCHRLKVQLYVLNVTTSRLFL